MNIGFIAHSSRKDLIENFCVAYKYILAKNELFATEMTGRRIEQATNLKVHKFLSGTVGGEKQFVDMIQRGYMDLVIFFYNPIMNSPNEPDIIAIPSSSSYEVEEESSSSEEEIEESSSSEEIEVSSSSEEEEDSSSSEEDVEESSSSVQPASSSTGYELISKVKPCRNADIDTCQYGILEDTRDGKTYKTIVIGEQTWMAQNLNYDLDDNRRQCCYRNQDDLCSRFGKLYTWAGAMDYDKNRCQDAAYCSLASHQGICPDGWRVPVVEDWDTLWMNVGYNSENLAIDSNYKYKVIRALITDTSYITWDRSGKGDYFGFSATEHGYRESNQGSFWSLYTTPSAYWTSDQVGATSSKAYIASMYSSSVDFEQYSKTGQFAVRCIKNREENGDE